MRPRCGCGRRTRCSSIGSWRITAKPTSIPGTGRCSTSPSKSPALPKSANQATSPGLRELDYTDEDILHIAELTAIFNYKSTLANATGLVPNAEYHELGRQPEPGETAH